MYVFYGYSSCSRSPLIPFSVYPKLKNLTSIHYHPLLMIGGAERSRSSYWSMRTEGREEVPAPRG